VPHAPREGQRDGEGKEEERGGEEKDRELFPAKTGISGSLNVMVVLRSVLPA